MTGPSGDQPYQPYSDKPQQPYGSQPPSYGDQAPYSDPTQQAPTYGSPPPYGSPQQSGYPQQPSYPPQAPPPPYSDGGYPAPAGPAPLSNLAVFALVTGIFCGVIGIIFGVLGLKDTKNGVKRGRGLAIAGIILGSLVTLGGIVVVLALTVFGAAVVDRLATNLEVGECIETIPTGDTVYTLDKVDCSEPHRGEAFATVTAEDADVYPGVDVMLSYQTECQAQFPEGSGPDQVYDLFLLYPTETTWDAGDRTIICLATTTDTTTGSIS